MIRLLVLIARMHAAYPHAPIVDVARTATAAVDAERDWMPAEVLVSIAQHESDLKPNAVSYLARGRRVDNLWTAGPLPHRVVCGYLQHMATGPACARSIAAGTTMQDGVTELAEWSRTCRGDVACVLRGHAGGSACARDRSSCSTSARVFSELFLAHARRLGWRRKEVSAAHRSDHRS